MTFSRTQLRQFVKDYETHGSLKEVARKTKLSWHTVHDLYEGAVAASLMSPLRPGRKTIEHTRRVVKGSLTAKVDDEHPIMEGQLKAKGYRPLPLHKGKITRFLFTSQQNNTPVHEGLWKNLQAFAKYVGATIHVSQYAYVKRGLGASGSKDRWLKNEKYAAAKSIEFDPITRNHLCNDRVVVAPGLVFCGDQNILPTMARPLAGFEVFTGRASGIFPHPKFAMESIATVNTEEPTKFNYTTGTITMRNYIQRRAGMLAEFHHCYGALLVEVDKDGNWWCRQVNADSEGNFYELDTRADGCILVQDGKITGGHRAEAITMGDVHLDEIDPLVKRATWGSKGMVDVLRPKYQFIHDLLNFGRRSHHSIKNPHLQFIRHVAKKESVEVEVMDAADFLEDTYRDYCQTVVVDSNHDRHLGRWLQEQNALLDPINAQYWLKLQCAAYEAMKELGEEPNYIQIALQLANPALERKFGVQFLPPDGSYVICHEFGGGIECGLHGDRGPNGARGSARNIARMGRKANVGHSHSACIVDGVYQSGTSSKLRLEYNPGPSSWSQAHILTYPNGKRAIITLWEGRWRA